MVMKKAIISKLVDNNKLFGYRLGIIENDSVKVSFDIPEKYILKTIRGIGLDNLIQGDIIEGTVDYGVFKVSESEDVISILNEGHIDEVLKAYFLDLDEDINKFLGGIGVGFNRTIMPLDSLFSNCNYIKKIYKDICYSLEDYNNVGLSVKLDTDRGILEGLDYNDFIDVSFDINVENINDALSIILSNIKKGKDISVQCNLSCIEGDFDFCIDVSNSYEGIINIINKNIGSFSGIDGFIGNWYIAEDRGYYIVSIDETIIKKML